jgi:HSP20 family molecular chaperone IbpA
MIQQTEVVEQQIARLETLYQQLTGKKFKPSSPPAAPIPPEADPESYVLENLQRLQAALSGFVARPTGIGVAPQTLPLRLNVLESEKEWICQFEVPGIPKEDISIQSTAGMLRVSCLRRGEANGHRPVHLELMPARLERTVPVPQMAKAATAQARLERGLLTIRFEKGAAPPSTKEINIEVH